MEFNQGIDKCISHAVVLTAVWVFAHWINRDLLTHEIDTEPNKSTDWEVHNKAAGNAWAKFTSDANEQ